MWVKPRVSSSIWFEIRWCVTHSGKCTFCDCVKAYGGSRKGGSRNWAELSSCLIPEEEQVLVRPCVWNSANIWLLRHVKTRRWGQGLTWASSEATLDVGNHQSQLCCRADLRAYSRAALSKCVDTSPNKGFDKWTGGITTTGNHSKHFTCREQGQLAISFLQDS